MTVLSKNVKRYEAFKILLQLIFGQSVDGASG
jgi:hypothetical protein